jgi:hypothetical protein
MEEILIHITIKGVFLYHESIVDNLLNEDMLDGLQKGRHHHRVSPSNTEPSPSAITYTHTMQYHVANKIIHKELNP